MAVYSLPISSNCSSLNLRPIQTSGLIRPSANPYRHIAPSHGRSRSLILALGMQPSSISESSQAGRQDISSTTSSTDNSIIAQTSSTTTATSIGLNVQLLSLASNLPPWAKLALGSLVLLAIPFCRKTIRLQDVTKKVETAVEAVEMAAEATEKVAVELIHVLPDGWLKDAAVKLEKIALLVDKSAEVTESIIDKVDDVAEVLDAAVLNGEKKNIS